MKILIIGADGFIGRAVVAALSADHEVYRGLRDNIAQSHDVRIDLLDPASITSALQACRPEVIVNCAGVIDPTSTASLNQKFTRNLLDAALTSGLEFRRIIILGSAGEYGRVDPSSLPVSEDVALRGDTQYALDKIAETQLAAEYAHQHHMPVVVARIFNPLGVGMQPKFLTSRLMGQIHEIRRGERDYIEVGRLDATRDYIDVRDVASAIKMLAENEPAELVYNVGSGVSTSNKELVELMVDNSSLSVTPRLVETSAEPEMPVASQANINRLQNEFSWKPTYTVEDSIKEIIHDADK